MAGGIQALSADPEYKIINEGMTIEDLQAHLLVGMGASAPCPLDRGDLRLAVAFFWVTARIERRLRWPLLAFSHWWVAGVHRLVDGVIRLTERTMSASIGWPRT